jgi:hypothetical protein
MLSPPHVDAVDKVAAQVSGVLPMDQVNYDDKVVITPVELYRDRELNGECYALFGVMKSFGPFARAKVGSYASRLGWHEDRVKKYQRVLQKAGWIVLVREGYDDVPRLWWMCRVKGEQPPQGYVDGGGKTRPPKNTAPVKHGGRKTRGPGNTPPKQKKVLQAVEVINNQREKAQSNSGKSKTSLSSASPTTGQEALALMNPAYRGKHGRDLDPSDGPKALAAAKVYGPDLVAAWQRFVADPGTRGYMDQLRHPIPIFTSQPNLWRPSSDAAGAGVDPARAAASRAAKNRAAADSAAVLAAEEAAERILVSRWPSLPAQLRDQVVAKVAGLSDFMADLVDAWRRKQGGVLRANSVVCTAILETCPELVKEA